MLKKQRAYKNNVKIIFMYGTFLEGIEQLVIPNFQSRRSGIVINNYFLKEILRNLINLRKKYF